LTLWPLTGKHLKLEALTDSHPLTDLTEISLNTIVNANDPSALLNPWVLIDLFPAVKLTLARYVPVGDDDSQNGKFGVSGFARIKIFF
jgi:hypothetical protein